MTLFEEHIAEIPLRNPPIFPGDPPQIASCNLDHIPIEEFKTAEYTPYRDPARKEFGFGILTDAAIEAIREYGPFLEVGAGTGYWSFELLRAGIDTVATDKEPGSTYGFEKTWTEIKKLDAVSAVRRYSKRTLLMVWPCYDSNWAHKALTEYKGNYLIYVGEGYGGCTADDGFHQELNDNWKSIKCIDIPQWSGLHDMIEIFERGHSPNKGTESK